MNFPQIPIYALLFVILDIPIYALVFVILDIPIYALVFVMIILDIPIYALVHVFVILDILFLPSRASSCQSYWDVTLHKDILLLKVY